MYKSIRIQNFRGLTDLRIEDLGRVNLVVGANNVGKTSLLEALWLFSGADDPSRAIELAEMRDYRPSLSAIAPAWRDMFQSMDVDREIVISAVGQAHGERELRISSSPAVVELVERGGQQTLLPDMDGDDDVPSFVARPVLTFELRQGSSTISANTLRMDRSTSLYRVGRVQEQRSVFIPAGGDLGDARLATMFTGVEDRGRLDSVIADMQPIFPTLRKLSLGYRDYENRPVLRAFLDDVREAVPYYLFGEGPKRVLNFLLAIHATEASTLLVDEFENGIYYEALEAVWSNLNRTSQESQIQIFATTHSWECVSAAVEAFEDCPADFRLYRLEQDGNRFRAVTYEHDVARAAVSGFVEFR